MSATASWRSPLLGERLELDLPEGRLECFRRGSGPPIVFAHGWLANANLWRRVVDELAGEFTCIALDLPLGAHRVPIPDAPLDPAGVGKLIAGAIDALELRDVTLIGNDSGGAYSQVALASDGARVARLVLTNCETPFDDFPPPPFEALPGAARNPDQLGQLLQALRDPEVRKLPGAFGLLVKQPLDPQASDSYALPVCEDPAIVADVARAMAGADTSAVHAAGNALIRGWDKPVLFAWAPDDSVFPLDHAQRYAADLRNSRLVTIADSYSFVAEDQPVALARALASRA